MQQIKKLTQFVSNKFIISIIILIFPFINLPLSGTNYYVKNTGNDSNTGLSDAEAWKTITKINLAFSSFKPGDKILFKRGDTFYGTIRISASGDSGNPIIISNYGSGVNPIICGFITISGWSYEGGGIYSKTLTVESNPNMVTIDGVNTVMGRYPHNTWLTIDSHVSNTTITDAELQDASVVNWTGAELVMRKKQFILDRHPITDHSGHTLTYSSSTGSLNNASLEGDGWGYFIQNDIKTLTTLGDWYYGDGKFYMYFGAVDPTTKVVKVSTIDKLIYSNTKSYIVVENISFEGANLYANDLYGSDHITIQNCNFNFTGRTAIWAQRFWATRPYLIDNNTINNSNNNAIYLEGNDNTVITNNTISNTGVFPGMGWNAFTAYSAIIVNSTQQAYSEKSSSLIQYNHITNTGNMGISFGGNNVTIKNNFINTFCLNKSDAGGIYTGASYQNGIISENIIINGIGAPGGSLRVKTLVHGIYLDAASTDFTISGNTIANIISSGIFLSSTDFTTVTDNTVYNCGYNCSNPINSALIQLADYGAPSYESYTLHDITITNNKLIAKSKDQYCISHQSVHDDIKNVGTIDYNFYSRPIDNNDIFENMGAGGVIFYHSFAEWQSLIGQDVHSYKSTVTTADTTGLFRFIFNTTSIDSYSQLNVPMIDIKGVQYTSGIVLSPYTSAVLIVDPNPTLPAVPVYTGSVIENSTPSILEISYDLILAADVVPATSAFSVNVNGVNRAINSIAISGTMVLLTLAASIIYGDVVKVAYTKPNTDPLQTASKVQAATIAYQAVKNNTINVPPTVSIISPANNAEFKTFTYITILAGANDPDGSIKSVEFYNGNTLLGTISTSPYSFTWESIISGTYTLTAVAIDNQNSKTVSSAISVSVIDVPVITNQPPSVMIANPSKGDKYYDPADISIDVLASDPDGTLAKVALYNGKEFLHEFTSASYSFTWKGVKAGTYTITAIATDNANAAKTSAPIEIIVGKKVTYDSIGDFINLYPNPNYGQFTIEVITPLQSEKSEIIIIDLSGNRVYSEPILKEETSKQFDLSNIRTGVYIMSLINNQILITKKFVKR